MPNPPRWRRTRFHVHTTPDGLTIRLACEGDPAVGARRFLLTVHGLGSAPSQVRVDGSSVPFEWQDRRIVLTLDPIADCEIRVAR